MKNFLVYAGNRFYEAQEKALSLGYKYPDPHEEPRLNTFYLKGTASGSLCWCDQHPEDTTIMLDEFIALTIEEAWDLSECKFCTGQWVIVKNKVQGWKLDIYSHQGSDSRFPHVCVSGNWSPETVLPLEGNEHLLGTLNDH